MDNEQPEPATAWVVVDCPACGNLNRAARRACTTCGRQGKVRKSVPQEPALNTETR